jgi:hypothetical protein
MWKSLRSMFPRLLRETLSPCVLSSKLCLYIIMVSFLILLMCKVESSWYFAILNCWEPEMYDCILCWRPQNRISISFSFFLLPRHGSSTRVPPGFTVRPAVKCVNYVYTVELHLSGCWSSGSPNIRIGLALRVNIFVLQLYYIFLWLQFSSICQIRIRNYVWMFYVYVNKYVA